MTGKQQQAHLESFDSINDFFAWYNKAKKEYEENRETIDIGNGTIDLGEIAGGN